MAGRKVVLRGGHGNIYWGSRSKWWGPKASVGRGSRVSSNVMNTISSAFPNFSLWGLPGNVLKVSHVHVLRAKCTQQIENAGRAVLLCCRIRAGLKPSAGAGLASSSVRSAGSVTAALLPGRPVELARWCG